MLKRVSDEKKMDWVNDGPNQFNRDSMNKSAMDSFAKVVTEQAHKLLASGSSTKDVAEKFKIKEAVLTDMLNSTQSCGLEQHDKDQETKRAQSEYEKFLDDAEAARKNLHGIKDAGTPNLPVASSKRILSGKGLDMTDMGGPHKQMGYERNNSIFDSEVIKRHATEKSNDERIRAENAAIAKRRADIKNAQRYETINSKDFEESLKNNTSKGNSVFQAPQQEAHKYNAKLPTNGISIFDSGAFDRVVEKTAGERRRDEIAKEAAKPKDRSWVERGAKSVNSKDIISSMIESMLGKKE